jgi:hypothetical protein
MAKSPTGHDESCAAESQERNTMNASTVAKNYGSLTPEERFRLILAARGRGDEAEWNRLANAGARIGLSVADYSPYARAFDEVALLIYIELLEQAASYLEALNRADDMHVLGDEGEDDEAQSTDGSQGATAVGAVEDDPGERPVWKRALDLALATGFVLRTKADGWKNVLSALECSALPAVARSPGLRPPPARVGNSRRSFLRFRRVRWLDERRSTDRSLGAGDGSAHC